MTANYVRGASLTCADVQTEIRTMLAGAGAEEIHLGPGHGAAVSFAHGGRRFRVTARPDRRKSRESVQEAARLSWRQLSQLIRAKIEAVDAEIVTFDQEFLGSMVMPGGRTVFDAASPGIAAAYGRADAADGAQGTER